MSPSRDVMARTIIETVESRGRDKTCCPSDIARLLASDDEAWRDLMPQVRIVAADLARQGRIRISRGGETVDPSDMSGGPIRLGWPTK